MFLVLRHYCTFGRPALNGGAARRQSDSSSSAALIAKFARDQVTKSSLND